MFTKAKIGAAIGCWIVGLAPVTATLADDLDQLGDERCVTLSSISRTDVVDDQSVLFYMRDRTIYENQLPRRCPGLRSNRTFMYKTSLPQLCDLDMITVLYNQGFGFSQGATCSLGRFHPISDDEAVALKAGERQPDVEQEPKEVPSAEPEEIEKPD